MHDNAKLLHDFYEAFALRDGDAMAEAYHPQARFSDPVFQDLDHNGVTAMWRMLTERGEDLVIEHSDVRADDDFGHARWEAWYTFETTGNKVHNVIDASFVFREGLILRHNDDFDFYRWSRQALGLPGTLLGWLPPMRTKVSGMAGKQLSRWRIKNG